MIRHILILSGNLAGLITAYRLVPYGFRITVLEPAQNSLPSASQENFSWSDLSEDWGSSLSEEPSPLILHNFYDSTWSLFQELALDQSEPPFQNIALEFTMAEQTVSVADPPRLSSFHPIMRLAFFKGLTWSDRWHLINFLEKNWEEQFPPDSHSDTLTVETWLLSASQSAHALKEIWNPLCRFFLGCDCTCASLGIFLEVLSRFWFRSVKRPEMWLAPPGFLHHLQQELKRRLLRKGVKFSPSPGLTRIRSDTDRIQTLSLANGETLSADAYISTLSPSDLLKLLPERAPARFSCFSYLDHLQEHSGTTVHCLLKDVVLSPRLILNTGLFDWVTCQTVPNEPKHTMITCVTLDSSSSDAHKERWLQDTVWTHVRKAYHIPPEFSGASSKPEIWQSTYTYFPCLAGFRTFRPVSGTPLLNLFLAGSWTATSLPPCLESTIASANACASALSEGFQAPSH